VITVILPTSSHPHRSPGTTALCAREDALEFRHEQHHDAARGVRSEFNLFVHLLIAELSVRTCRPFRSPDRDDETGRNEERRPHLRSVRAIVIAADFQSHESGYRRIKGENSWYSYAERNTVIPNSEESRSPFFGATLPRTKASTFGGYSSHWSNTMTTTANFFYRENSDSTIDSICPRCFQTIASGRILNELKGAEQEHTCFSLEELHQGYVDSQRDTF